MDYRLNNIDPDDISEILKKVERSFNFTFAHNELKDISTFGELCAHIHAKVEGRHVSDCTTQQAFYKIRQAIAKNQALDERTITPRTRLEHLYPPKGRRKNIRLMKKHLGLTSPVLTWPEKKFKYNTVGELACVMARHHYSNSRRHPGTVNRHEIEQTIIDLFSYGLGLEPSIFTRTATFN